MPPTGRRKWVKLWTATLYGSTMKELTPSQRWVWVGLLLLAGDSPEPGVVCIKQGVPYTRQQLAKILGVDLRVLENAINRLQAANKVYTSKQRCLVISNWNHYQGDYERVRRHRERQIGNGGEVTTNETE